MKCRCGKTVRVPEFWHDESGNHSRCATIACDCGIQVSIPLREYYGGTGKSGWEILQIMWNTARKLYQNGIASERPLWLYILPRQCKTSLE